MPGAESHVSFPIHRSTFKPQRASYLHRFVDNGLHGTAEED
jgi:hypothetical protein